jgi:oligopeptide/dipeptide ABC transporter ATP-binding protein
MSGVTERGTALLFITHDLAVVATVCERVLVMYGGRIIEAGSVHDVFTRPRHPYTRGLLNSSDLEASDETGRLRTIPGTVPAAGRFPSGCVFRNRCERATQQCVQLPRWESAEAERELGAATRPDDREGATATARGYACWHPLEERRDD